VNDVSRHPHPVDRPVLPFLMIAFVVIGAAAAANATGDDGSLRPAALILAIASVTSFVVLLGVYSTGWVLRGHELWRDERRAVADRG
jgi:hypothetical protein